MKILLISTNRNQLPVPVMPVGACIVAEAAAGAGHEVGILDLMFRKDPLRAVERTIEKTDPDVVGLSIRNIDNNDMQHPAFFIEEAAAVAEAVRRKTSAPIVLGGSAVGVMPEEIMRYTGLSCAVIADGETVFPRLLDNVSEGKSLNGLAGTAWMEGDAFMSSPSSVSGASCKCPAPDFGRWINREKYLSRMAAVPVQSKLGCHFQCIYCTYRKIEGSRYRLFERGSVTESIKKLASSGVRNIEFVDNVFNSPYEHAISLCEDLTQFRHKACLYSLELNPFHTDDRLITLMERAGFKGVGITVESASGTVLERLRKGYSAESVYHAAEVIKRHKLPCVWIFMLGGPGETESTIEETLKFAEKFIRPGDTAFFNMGIRIYPGTELESIAREEGSLTLNRNDMLRPVFYISPELDAGRMLARVRKSMAANMNFINSDSIGLSFLPLIHRIGYGLGIRSPLWKYTRFIRRGLRLAGVDA